MTELYGHFVGMHEGIVETRIGIVYSNNLFPVTTNIIDHRLSNKIPSDKNDLVNIMNVWFCASLSLKRQNTFAVILVGNEKAGDPPVGG